MKVIKGFEGSLGGLLFVKKTNFLSVLCLVGFSRSIDEVAEVV